MLLKKQAFITMHDQYLGRQLPPDQRGVGAVISGRFSFVQIDRFTT